MSVEFEKAFGIAVKEMREAFQTAKENVQKSVNRAPIVCPNCGETNSASAVFCSKCGKNLSAKSKAA